MFNPLDLLLSTGAIFTKTASVIVGGTKLIEIAIKGTTYVGKWIVQEEIQSLSTTIDFIVGKKLIECLSGRQVLLDFINSLYITTRFVFLGTLIAPVFGIKILLSGTWLALVLVRISLRSTGSEVAA